MIASTTSIVRPSWQSRNPSHRPWGKTLPATGALSAAESALENAGIRPSAALRLDGNAADLLQSIKDIVDGRGIAFDPAT